MNASEIKQALFGIYLTDGHLDHKNNLEVYTQYETFHNHLVSMFDNFPNSQKKIWKKEVYNKRFNTTGYRFIARYPAYFKKFKDVSFKENRKYLTPEAIKKITPITLAYMWMGDGNLKHSKNKKINHIQNIGRWSLESFSYEELTDFGDYVFRNWDIAFKYFKVPTGYGWNIRIQGEDLQKFVSLIYPYIQPCFYYKTLLFYKTKSFCNHELPSAEHFMKYYTDISEREDIVQSYKKLYSI